MRHLGTSVTQAAADTFARPDGAIGTASDGQTWLVPTGKVAGFIPVSPSILSHVAVASSNTAIAVGFLPASGAGYIETVIQPLGGAVGHAFVVVSAVAVGGGAYDVLTAGVNGSNVPFLESLLSDGLPDYQHAGSTISPPNAGDRLRVVIGGGLVSLLLDGNLLLTGSPPARYFPVGLAGLYFLNVLPQFSDGYSSFVAGGYLSQP